MNNLQPKIADLLPKTLLWDRFLIIVKDIGEILEDKKYRAPDEIEVIKEFVRQKFNVGIGVQVKTDSFILIVDNSSLAGALRMELLNLQNLLKTDKKLIIRIG